MKFLFHAVANLSCPLWLKNIRLLDSHGMSLNPTIALGMWCYPGFQPYLLLAPITLWASCYPCCLHRLDGHWHPPAFAQDLSEAGMHLRVTLFCDLPIIQWPSQISPLRNQPWFLYPHRSFFPFASVAHPMTICSSAHWMWVCLSPSCLSTSSEQAQHLAQSYKTAGTYELSPRTGGGVWWPSEGLP